MGSVIKKRRKRMAKKKHRKLLKKTRVQRVTRSSAAHRPEVSADGPGRPRHRGLALPRRPVRAAARGRPRRRPGHRRRRRAAAAPTSATPSSCAPTSATRSSPRSSPGPRSTPSSTWRASPPRSARAAARSMKEINVIGTMQLLAACQKAPTVRKLVVKSSTAVYGSSPRDPAMFTEDMEPSALPRTGLRQGLRRGRGLRPRLRPAPPRRRASRTLRFANFHRPAGRHAADALLLAAGGADRARLRPAAAVRATRTTLLEALRARDRSSDAPGTFNVAGDGVLMLSPGHPPRRAARRVPLPRSRSHGRAALARPRARRLLRRAGRLPHLRPGRRHQPDARRARLRAALHHRGGVRDFASRARTGPAELRAHRGRRGGGRGVPR